MIRSFVITLALQAISAFILFGQTESEHTNVHNSGPLPIGAIGVVTIPSIFPIEGEMPKSPKSVPIRKHPKSKSPLISTLRPMTPKTADMFWKQLQSIEIAYQSSAAVVYLYNQDWFLVKTHTGKGYISKSDIKSFIPLEMLLKNKLSYLTEEWDGTLWDSPSISARTLCLKNEQSPNSRPSAKFLQCTWADGQLWLNILLVKSPPCGNSAAIDKDTTGWVPAYGHSGNLILWFYSRGC